MSSCKMKSVKTWLMTLMLLVTVAISGNAISIHSESDTAQELNLVDLKIIDGLYHGEPSTEHTVEGNKYSVHWNNHTTNKQLLLGFDEGSMPNNWNGYEYLELEIYSEAATGEKIVPSVWTRAEGTNYYFWNLIEVNWTGSKTIKLRFNTILSPSTLAQAKFLIFLNAT